MECVFEEEVWHGVCFVRHDVAWSVFSKQRNGLEIFTKDSKPFCLAPTWSVCGFASCDG